MLCGAAVLATQHAALAAGASASPGRASPNRPAPDPRSSADGQVKLNAALDGSAAYWTYAGLIYAVLPRMRPKPILRVAGCQANWANRQPDGSFRLAAPLLSYFRDVRDGAFLEAYDNPFSGRRNEVRANMFLGAGRAVYPADGSAMQILGSINATESAPRGFDATAAATAIGRVEWSMTHDTVVLNTDQFFDVRQQPQAEAQTRTADRAAFFDEQVVRLPARFTATTVTPWLGWMDMGDSQGHLVWHTHGEKVFSIDELPTDYRRRAGGLLDRLSIKPDV